MIADFLNVSKSHPPIVSAVVGAIQSTLQCPLYEAPTITSHLSLGKHEAEKYGSFSMLHPKRTEHELLISIKLLLNDIKPKFVSWEDVKAKRGEATFVIDSPAQSQLMAGYSSRLLDPALSIEKLAAHDAKGRIMVIVTSSKASKPQFSSSVKLASADLYSVMAVIDFSGFSAKGRITEYSLVILDILRQGLQPRPGVLLVDATQYNKRLSHLDLEERALLAGQIYNIWEGRTPDFESNAVPSRVRRILRAQFFRGYTDVKQLCYQKQLAESVELENLTARGNFPVDNGSGDLECFLVDCDPIIRPLLDQSAHRCAYIIGNNGQGKSLLLRELVFRLAAARKKSVGISISLADRFPFQEAQVKHHFKYEGARTAEETLSLATRSHGISKSIAVVFRNQTHLDVFSRCLQVLDFEPRHYLVRRDIHSLDNTASKKSNYIKLSPDASTNALPTHLDRYEFAIVRADGEARITPFSNLSSGEQNIFLLLIKLIESARTGKVILLDEPEISLHVKWQQAIPMLLELISDTYKVSIVIATHSPVLIANASAQSFCYRADEGALYLIPVDERNSVETILLDGFRTKTPSNREVHEKCARLVADVIEQKNAMSGAKLQTDAIDRLDTLRGIVADSEMTSNPKQLRAELDLISKAKLAISAIIAQEAVEND
jgi:predicted ATPase